MTQIILIITIIINIKECSITSLYMRERRGVKIFLNCHIKPTSSYFPCSSMHRKIRCLHFGLCTSNPTTCSRASGPMDKNSTSSLSPPDRVFKRQPAYSLHIIFTWSCVIINVVDAIWCGLSCSNQLIE